VTAAEAARSFSCFGSKAAVYVGGAGADGQPSDLSARIAQRQLLSVHSRLSRFADGSELSLLNADPRETVPASRLLRRFARAAVEAGTLSGGLVDATVLPSLEQAGYSHSREGEAGLGAHAILRNAPARCPARPSPETRWRTVSVDDHALTITRPVGVRLDGGGIVKGLAADLVASTLRDHASYAVDCAGDMAIGGTGGAPRAVSVDDPFGGEVVTEFAIAAGAVATSGIGRRSWVMPGGGPGHHLIDPSTGRPAYTGVVQVTALAPTALEAEIRAKAALLSGPERAASWLSGGGVVILEDRSVEIVAARAEEGDQAVS
jgi:thiamine biosynthesis lipoprotein